MEIYKIRLKDNGLYFFRNDLVDNDYSYKYFLDRRTVVNNYSIPQLSLTSFLKEITSPCGYEYPNWNKAIRAKLKIVALYPESFEIDKEEIPPSGTFYKIQHKNGLFLSTNYRIGQANRYKGIDFILKYNFSKKGRIFNKRCYALDALRDLDIPEELSLYPITMQPI